MQRIMVRGGVWGLFVVLAVVLLACPKAEGQDKGKDKDKKGPDTPEGRPAQGPIEFSAWLTLPADTGLKKKLDAVHDYVQIQSWDVATQLLQGFLDAPEDRFVPIHVPGPGGKDTVRWASVRAEANRLLGGLPAEGLKFYELAYGRQARARLDEARTNNDLQLLAEVSARFLHTEAGAEALNFLGTYHLDRGYYLQAALCFERLIARTGGDRVAPFVLFKAAVALHRAGDVEGAGQLYNRLGARVPAGIKVGDKHLGLVDLRKELGNIGDAPLDPQGAGAWLTYRGDPGRSARGAGDLTSLDAKWKAATVHKSDAQRHISEAMQKQEGANSPILPGFFPVPAGDRLVFRTHRGINAVDRQTGKLFWESETLWGLDQMVEVPTSYRYANGWVDYFVRQTANGHILYENTVTGTISTDLQRVYAVDDLAVVPVSGPYTMITERPGGAPIYPLAARLSDAVFHSKLRAVDLTTGKLVWEVGGKAEKKENGITGPLQDAFFLAPPLPLGGKLYTIIDQGTELRMVCIEPATGELCWSQKLATLKKDIPNDPLRRQQAAHLAYSDGILVCPTQSGALIAVDLLSRSLLWAHAYRDPPPEPPMVKGPRPVPIQQQQLNLQPDWKHATVLLQDGKVLFTAADAPVLSCLNLRDGSLRWKINKSGDDLYLAGVFKNKVLLVGKQLCRAVNLQDGKQLWSIETGVPSGQGVLVDGTYYLPVKASAQGKPGVLALDVDKGAVKDRIQAKELPGNLLFHEGQVFSQTATGITAYPQKRDSGE